MRHFLMVLVGLGMVISAGAGLAQTATPTDTPVPPTATNTPVPPTATNTPIPPTATITRTPTNTPVDVTCSHVSCLELDYLEGDAPIPRYRTPSTSTRARCSMWVKPVGGTPKVAFRCGDGVVRVLTSSP